MFKKTERLTQAEFQVFFNKGKRNNFKHLTIITSPHPTLKTAVVVGKKVAKKAVKRNKIKRRVFNSLRVCIEFYKKQMVFIIMIKPSYTHLTRKEADTFLCQSIAQVLKSE